MPDLNDLLRMRGCLKKGTKTRVSRADGRVEEERRAPDSGQFEVIFAEVDGNENGQESGGASEFKPSKRQQKWAGMVIDYRPDLQLARVADGVYLSGQDVAQDLELLLRHGISHVVNAATGVRCRFPDKITYLEVAALDVPTENLKRHFQKATEFMRKAVEGGRGQVLVHCNAGISRSSTIVLAYLMRYQRLGLDQALAHVRAQRPIARPNDGFMRQLREFEQEIGLLAPAGATNCEPTKQTNTT